jgi:Ni,Fe-hydrogenase III large subunit
VTAATDILHSAQAVVCRPWLRHSLSHAGWAALAAASLTEAWTLLAHWGDTVQVHALFLDPSSLMIVPISTGVETGHYPALSPLLPSAAWYERMIQDLWGHVADGGTDERPWLDHAAWAVRHPMAVRPQPAMLVHPADAIHSEEMVLPLGPIWGRLDEPAQLRLTLHGAAIRHAEARLGFTHKGTLMLMRGKSPRTAARFAARLSGDATVAHSIAFAHATEAAMHVQAPPRAVALRIVMLEVERIAGHLDNLAEVGRLCDAAAVHASCGALRETLVRAAEAAFGHRLMMDCVVPGGVAGDMAAGSPELILRALGDIASQVEQVRRLHNGPALSSRLSGLGRASGTMATALGVGGVVGRASGRAFDQRIAFSPGYEQLSPRIVTLPDGDAAARQSLRILEIEESLRFISTALGSLPEGPVTVALPHVSGEGIGSACSHRGDIWYWLRLDHGQIAAVFPRDPSWALWPLAECVLTKAAADDVTLIRASFGLSASGMDL